MTNIAILDTLDHALNRMIDGADAELCACDADTHGDALRPLLQVAQSLFALADEAEHVLFTSRHGADGVDWTALLAATQQRCATASVAAG